MNDECTCVDCQTEIEFGQEEMSNLNESLDQFLCYEHGESNCPLCTHGIGGYDC